jgi:Tfp pilus assembly protein PilF
MNFIPIFALLPTLASVSGNVYMGSDPIAGLEIEFSRGGTVVAMTTTDKAGDFMVTAITPGVYNLKLTKSNVNIGDKTGKATLTVPTMLIEDGSNRMTLYWPPEMSQEDKMERVQYLMKAGAKALADGDYTAAARQFQSATMIECFQSPVWASLALAQVGMKKYADAIESGTMAVRLSPNDAGYRNNLGGTYFRLGKFKDAETRFIEAAQLSESGKGLYYGNAGSAAFAMNNYQRAAELYGMAVAAPGALFSSWFFLGESLLKTGNNDQGYNALRKYLEIDPNGPYAAAAKQRLESGGNRK